MARRVDWACVAKQISQTFCQHGKEVNRRLCASAVSAWATDCLNAITESDAALTAVSVGITQSCTIDSRHLNEQRTIIQVEVDAEQAADNRSKKINKVRIKSTINK